MAEVGVGVIGLGFMGRTHVEAVRAAQARGLPCRLRAVCDGDGPRLAGAASIAGNLPQGAGAGPGEGAPSFDPAEVRRYASADELIADPQVALVHVCTWTDTHFDLARRALAAGKHVVVEKPVALRSEEVESLADVARGSGRLCMPAMCMRFWPGWPWLRERVRERTYGDVLSAVFRRVGSAPGWSHFYADERRSGGALFDLHVHDVDFIAWCFGEPQEICTAGTLRHVTTLYRYRGGPAHVVAEGGWTLAPAAGFRMQYLVSFEGATADFDVARQPQLLLHAGDRTEAIPLPQGSGYEAEVAAAVQAVATGDLSGLPTLEEAVMVTRLLEREKERLAAR